MQCPECPKGLASRRKSAHINKNGNKKGKQNYICVRRRKAQTKGYARM